MNDKIFWDTNVLVYAFDASSPDKRDKAREMLGEGIRTSTLSLSWQVIQEFANVALHKFEQPMPVEELRELMDTVLFPHCDIYPSRSLYDRALRIHALTQYRFYDSLIVAGALAAGVETLYSEDLQEGRCIESVQIVNPFRAIGS